MFDHVATLDPAMHANLLAVKRYEGDPADLCLDFTVEHETLGVRTVQELIPGGRDIAVSASNVLLYVHVMAAHVQGRVAAPIHAFATGLQTVRKMQECAHGAQRRTVKRRLHRCCVYQCVPVSIRINAAHTPMWSSQIIPPHWLRMFSAGEINQLLGGGKGGDWDVDDLARHTHFSGGYDASSRTCKHFFAVVRGMDASDRSLLLRFVTSCPRPPLGGFRDLSPRLRCTRWTRTPRCLQRLGARTSSGCRRRRRASTCSSCRITGAQGRCVTSCCLPFATTRADSS